MRSPASKGVYDRHHYAEEKGGALKQLAALVERIVNPPEANVVAMPEARRRRAASRAGRPSSASPP
jgi:hypothetical protein